MKKLIKIIIWFFAIIAILAIVGGFAGYIVYKTKISKVHRPGNVMEVNNNLLKSEISPSDSTEVNTTSLWRGNNRDGIYNETGLLKEWAANGPELLWFTEELGDGYTSPAIANRRIYITGLYSDDLVLSVFDLSGQLLRRKIVGKEWNTSYPGTRCSVTVNDGKLYIYNSLGHLHCLDEETLELIWKKDVFTDFDGRNIMWGVTESPLIVGDKIFITPGGKKYNMVALNKNTGELIWFSTGEGNHSSYSSPLYVSNYSFPMVVVVTEKDIIAYNADTGEKAWAYPQINNRNIHPNSPFYSDGMIFSTTGYGGGSMLLRLKDDGKAVEQVWNNNADNQMGGAVKMGDYVYTSGHNNRGFYCMDWNTGEIKYKDTQISPCAIIAADGMMYVYSAKGEVALVKPNPNQLELVSIFKETKGTNQHWAHPVIHDGVLYIRHGDALMAYKVK